MMWLWLILGAFIGANLGVIIMALFIAGKNGEIKEVKDYEMHSK